MAARVVVVYFSRLGTPLRTHEKAVLDASARRIADLKNWKFAGDCRGGFASAKEIFYVPDDTLLTDELSVLGIRSESDVFGGVVPYPFAKTKAVTHSLVDRRSARPDGWSDNFARRVRNVVLPGYTAFSLRDIRLGAKRMLSHGPLRLKKALSCGGSGQRVATTAHQVESFVENIPRDEITQFGIVLEIELHDVLTYSVGQIRVDDMTIAYHGIQRTAKDARGRSVYGGSSLVCVRGGWDALEPLQMPKATRLAVTKARSYDHATKEYPGFMASRRNYDVGAGIDASGQIQSGVFEASWRCGGASTAELAALGALSRDPRLMLVEASTVKEFGGAVTAPNDAVIDFHGEDPIDGPVLRYTRIQVTPRA